MGFVLLLVIDLVIIFLDCDVNGLEVERLVRYFIIHCWFRFVDLSAGCFICLSKKLRNLMLLLVLG